MRTTINLISTIENFNYKDLHKIAKDNSIFIVEEDLGEKIQSYYHNVDEVKMIHVNSRLTQKEKMQATKHHVKYALCNEKSMKFLLM